METSCDYSKKDNSEYLNKGIWIVLFIKKMCPNCKAIEKMLEKYFSSASDLLYACIDSEEYTQTMQDFNVNRVPTLLVLKEGIVVGQKIGLLNLKEMNEFVSSALLT